MRRLMLPLIVVAAAMFAADSAFARRIAIPIQVPAVRAVTAQAVVVGKVTTIEKETVEAEPYPKAPKVAYKIAVIEIKDGLAGVGSLTHIKVGFQSTDVDPTAPRLSSRPQSIAVALDEEGCFFLTKHPSANFYVLNVTRPTLDSKADDYKTQLAEVKKSLAIVAEPLKSLKAEKADDRFHAATVLLTKYRTQPESGQAGREAVPAEESQLILKAISEQTDWTPKVRNTGPTYLVNMLGLTSLDGWQPQFNGQGDYNTFIRDQFKSWYAARGSKYAINKYVTKGN